MSKLRGSFIVTDLTEGMSTVRLTEGEAESRSQRWQSSCAACSRQWGHEIYIRPDDGNRLKTIDQTLCYTTLALLISHSTKGR